MALLISPLGPHAVLAVMKLAAGERMNVLADGSKKIQGLSPARLPNHGTAKVPENESSSKLRGYSLKLGNEKLLGAAERQFTVNSTAGRWV